MSDLINLSTTSVRCASSALEMRSASPIDLSRPLQIATTVLNVASQFHYGLKTIGVETQIQPREDRSDNLAHLSFAEIKNIRVTLLESRKELLESNLATHRKFSELSKELFKKLEQVNGTLELQPLMSELLRALRLGVDINQQKKAFQEIQANLEKLNQETFQAQLKEQGLRDYDGLSFQLRDAQRNLKKLQGFMGLPGVTIRRKDVANCQAKIAILQKIRDDLSDYRQSINSYDSYPNAIEKNVQTEIALLINTVNRVFASDLSQMARILEVPSRETMVNVIRDSRSEDPTLRHPFLSTFSVIKQIFRNSVVEELKIERNGGPYKLEVVNKAMKVLDLIIGSGSIHANPELVVLFDELPYGVSSLIRREIGDHAADPLPKIAEILTPVIYGRSAQPLIATIKSIQATFSAQSYLELPELFRRESPPPQIDTEIYRKVSSLVESIGAHSNSLLFWPKIRDSACAETLLKLLYNDLSVPPPHDFQIHLSQVDASIGEVVKNSLLQREEHASDTITLGYNLFCVKDPNLFPYKLMNAFREPGYSGERPFLSPCGEGSADESRLVMSLQALEPKEIQSLKALNLPGLVDAIDILQAHGQRALDYSVKDQSDKYQTNPLFLKLKSCVEKLSVHYLENGTGDEKYFSLGVLGRLGIPLQDHTVDLISDILETPHSPRLFQEAIRLAETMSSYSNSVKPEISAMILKSLASYDVSILSSVKANAAIHYFNLSKELVALPEIGMALQKIFGIDAQSFIVAKNFQTELVERGIIHGPIASLTHDSESRLDLVIGASQVDQLIPTIEILRGTGYEFSLSQLEAFPQLVKNVNLILREFRQIQSDFELLSSNPQSNFRYEPRQFYASNSSQTVKCFHVSPFRTSQMQNILNHVEQPIELLINLKNKYGVIPDQYLEAIFLAFSNNQDFECQQGEYENFKLIVKDLLTLSHKPRAKETDVLFEMLKSPSIKTYLTSKNASLASLKLLCLSRLDEEIVPQIKIAHIIFNQTLGKRPLLDLSYQQLETICLLLSPLLSDPLFNSATNLEGVATNSIIRKRYDAVVYTIVKVVSRNIPIDDLQNLIKESLPSAFSVIRALALVKESELGLLSTQTSLNALSHALPAHRNLEEFVSEGLPLFAKCNWIRSDSVQDLAILLPQMLKRNALTIDCINAYQSILANGDATFLSEDQFSISNELTTLMDFTQHFPGLSIPLIYEVYRVREDPSKVEFLRSLGLVGSGKQVIVEIKERMRNLGDRLLKTDQPIELDNQIDRELLLALIGYAGSSFSIMNIVQSYNHNVVSDQIVPLDPRYSDRRFVVDTLDLDKVRDFSFSKPAEERYQLFTSILMEIKEFSLAEIIQIEIGNVKLNLENRVASLEATLRATKSNDQNPKMKIGIERELDVATKTLSALGNSTNIADLVKLLTEYKNKDNPVTTPSLRKILLKLALEELSDPNNLYSTLSDTLSKLALEEITSLIQTNLKDEALVSLKLNSKQEQVCLSALSIASFREDLIRLANIDSVGKEEVLVHPTRGLLAELSGYNCGACWTRESDITKKYQNMTALIFIRNPDTPATRRIVGACILLKCKDLDGDDVFIVRGLNPTQNFITLLKAESFVENFIDQVIVPYAQSQGVVKILVPCDSAGGAQTNRPSIGEYFTRVYLDHFVELDPEGPNSTFNRYDIRRGCVLLRDLREEKI